MADQQRTFQVPEGLVSALLNYLGTRPFAEVNRITMALSQTVQAQLTPEELAAMGAAPAPAPQAPTSVNVPDLKVVSEASTKKSKAAKSESKS